MIIVVELATVAVEVAELAIEVVTAELAIAEVVEVAITEDTEADTVELGLALLALLSVLSAATLTELGLALSDTAADETELLALSDTAMDEPELFGISGFEVCVLITEVNPLDLDTGVGVDVDSDTGMALEAVEVEILSPCNSDIGHTVVERATTEVTTPPGLPVWRAGQSVTVGAQLVYVISMVE